LSETQDESGEDLNESTKQLLITLEWLEVEVLARGAATTFASRTLQHFHKKCLKIVLVGVDGRAEHRQASLKRFVADEPSEDF
jgi:hypothetical protein